jgi:hypothetical protein
VPQSKDIALPQFAITLVFWRRFGAPHWHKYSDDDREDRRDIRYHIDMNLRGRSVVFIPTLSRKTFEIGRASECYLRLGYNPDSKRDPTIPEDFYDEGGALAQPLFNHWSRKHATFELITQVEDGKLVGDWYIYPGGEFWNPATGIREWADATNLVYLNGQKVVRKKTDDPKKKLDPKRRGRKLFEGDLDIARVQLGDAGKIIISKGRLGPNTTSWPDDIWIGVGEGWPDMVAIAKARVAAAQAEVDTAQVLQDAAPPKISTEVTGRTMADVLAIVLVGPEGIDRRLWWALCGVVASGILWVLER